RARRASRVRGDWPSLLGLVAEQDRREIPRPGIRGDPSDAFAWPELTRDAQRGERDRATRHADEQPFVAGKLSRERKRFLFPHRDNAVDHASVEVGRNEARPHPLELMLSPLATREHRRTCRLDGDDADDVIALLEVAPNAADRASCP